MVVLNTLFGVCFSLHGVLGGIGVAAVAVEAFSGGKGQSRPGGLGAQAHGYEVATGFFKKKPLKFVLKLYGEGCWTA